MLFCIASFVLAPVLKVSELMAQKPKTFNYLRLRELLLQFSTEANLVVLYVLCILYLVESDHSNALFTELYHYRAREPSAVRFIWPG